MRFTNNHDLALIIYTVVTKLNDISRSQTAKFTN